MQSSAIGPGDRWRSDGPVLENGDERGRGGGTLGGVVHHSDGMYGRCVTVGHHGSSGRWAERRKGRGDGGVRYDSHPDVPSGQTDHVLDLRLLVMSAQVAVSDGLEFPAHIST
jgi:hypothetical protein